MLIFLAQCSLLLAPCSLLSRFTASLRAGSPLRYDLPLANLDTI